MSSHALSVAVFALALSHFAVCQTFTACNPMEKTCPGDPALGKTVVVDFTAGAHPEFTEEAGTTITYGKTGAEFTIDSTGAARTIISNHYIFFGRVETWIKSAPGQGIVSSFVLESDDLDEIDWEWFGGKNDQVETNYFGKHNTTDYTRATYPPIASPEDAFHNYTIDWTPSYIKWYADSKLLRTLSFADAVGGYNFPQTPMYVTLGPWAAGAPSQPAGTVEWAGGSTDLSKAPFTMIVANITIQDYTTSGVTYTYGDKSGSYESILIQDASGKSTSYTGSSVVGGGFGTTNSESSSSSSSSSTSTVVSSSSSQSHSSSTGSVSSQSTSKPSTSGTQTTTTSSPTSTQSKSSNAVKTTAGYFSMLFFALSVGYLFL